jgi:hypothetical protein
VSELRVNGVCRFLRWKSFREWEDEEDLRGTFARNQVPYTCLHTGQPWGPNDELAAPECCTDERDCFEPLVTLRRHE